MAASTAASSEKVAMSNDVVVDEPLPEQGLVAQGGWRAKLQYLKWYSTSKAGWLGDYACLALCLLLLESLTC